MSSDKNKDRVKALIKKNYPHLPDKEIDKVVDAQYAIANIMFDLWREKIKK